VTKTPANLPPAPTAAPAPVDLRDAVTLRFAGDSGDGMLLAGLQFTAASDRLGNDVHTIPLLPREIRAPNGSLESVYAFQVRFANHAIHTVGDRLDALVAMNPAALKLHLPDLVPGGLLIANCDAFVPTEFVKAGYLDDPLRNGILATYRVLGVPIDRLNRDALAEVRLLVPREADRCRNFFALGLACSVFQRPLDPILRWIRDTFVKNPVAVDANTRSLNAGYRWAESSGIGKIGVRGPQVLAPGKYRRLSGNEALSLGLAAAARQAGVPLVFAGFPSIAASDLQQHFFALGHLGVRPVVAENESAAVGMAIGAAFGGALGVTVTSGPGLCAASETLGLAVSAELPLVVIDVQRVGPGNGIAIASEQGDLLQSLFGRTGESPLLVLAPTSPADGFAIAFEAVRLSIRTMTPAIVLTDATLGNGSEPWRIPGADELPAIPIARPAADSPPFRRDADLVRPWPAPGMPGHEHRNGGLEKEENTGNASVDPINHERMVAVRAAKLERLAEELPLEIVGPDSGDLLVVGWGSAWGQIRAAVEKCQARGLQVAAAAVRHLHPLPAKLGPALARYRRVLVPELNAGQLRMVLRARYLVDAAGFSKVQGRPFEVAELVERIEQEVAQ
jgi:2-oxoglutarate/2-oxoacid ferredoxin oxidoreductase subunit alpha